MIGIGLIILVSIWMILIPAITSIAPAKPDKWHIPKILSVFVGGVIGSVMCIIIMGVYKEREKNIEKDGYWKGIHQNYKTEIKVDTIYKPIN